MSRRRAGSINTRRRRLHADQPFFRSRSPAMTDGFPPLHRHRPLARPQVRHAAAAAAQPGTLLIDLARRENAALTAQPSAARRSNNGASTSADALPARARLRETLARLRAASASTRAAHQQRRRHHRAGARCHTVISPRWRPRCASISKAATLLCAMSSSTPRRAAGADGWRDAQLSPPAWAAAAVATRSTADQGRHVDTDPQPRARRRSMPNGARGVENRARRGDRHRHAGAAARRRCGRLPRRGALRRLAPANQLTSAEAAARLTSACFRLPGARRLRRSRWPTLRKLA